MRNFIYTLTGFPTVGQKRKNELWQELKLFSPVPQQVTFAKSLIFSQIGKSEIFSCYNGLSVSGVVRQRLTGCLTLWRENMIRVIGMVDGVRRVYGDGNTYKEAWDQCKQAVYDYCKRRPDFAKSEWVLKRDWDNPKDPDVTNLTRAEVGI
jgi:hypothetical protein